ncbi:hypothetical protein NDU88_004069 [Pleurodeles waltl]|uniref:Uncharacterized protein n=1 Tax=Pleurodeles waltl TaxID=8319 RepID=A0AAV7MXH0_PLEWA|nr:hypothetical protein NDU88_004069 [Pleurodeles waltl]
MGDSSVQRKTSGTPPVFLFLPRPYPRGQNALRSTASLLAVLPPTPAPALLDRRGRNDPLYFYDNMPKVSQGKIPLTHGRSLQCSWCREEAGYPQSMHHLETVKKAGRMRRYKVASSRPATLLRFCRRPEQSAFDPLVQGEEGDAEELW